MIRELLDGKNGVEKAQIKSQEIISRLETKKHTEKDFEIEVIEKTLISGGIEVKARVFKNGVQLGFGDGSVDIERFLIFNPPILVPDSNGDISLRGRVYREDAVKAILESLYHTASLVGKEGTLILNNKVGKTTSTFYPNTSGSSPVDGRVARDIFPATESFSSIRGGTGNFASDSETNGSIGGTGSAADLWTRMIHGIFGFDTSTLGAGATINSATLSLYCTAQTDAFITTEKGINVVGASPASSSTLATSDYAIANFGSTAFSTKIDIGSWTTSAYNDFAFNASGISGISKTGNSFFGVVLQCVIDNTAPTTTGAAVASTVEVDLADQAGTTTDPKLVVDFTGAAGGSNSTLLFMGVG